MTTPAPDTTQAVTKARKGLRLKGMDKDAAAPVLNALRAVLLQGWAVEIRSFLVVPICEFRVTFPALKGRPDPDLVQGLKAAGYVRVTNHRWDFRYPPIPGRSPL